MRLELAYAHPERRVGVRRVLVAAGRQTEVIVPLWAAGRRRLRAEGRLSLRVRLVPGTTGIAGEVSQYVTLRVPRPQRLLPPVTG